MPSVMEVLHEATLKVLARTGVRVDSDLALDLLASGGVRVDRTSRRVYPHEEQVQRAFATTPHAYPVYGRHTDNPLVLGGYNAYVLSGGGSVRVLTLEGRYEPSSWEHLRQFNVLLDALPNIHMLLNQVDPQNDQDAATFYKRLAAEMLVSSPKPCCFQAGNAADVAAMIEMGVVLRGSREALATQPVFIVGANAEPPLHIPQHAAEIQIEASRADIPCGIGDYGMLGITAPISVAGLVVQLNAVQLTNLVLSQTVRPGAPFSYTSFSGSGNMRTLDPIIADPRTTKMLRLAAELGRYYDLPVYSEAVTDAKMPDPQAACERAVQMQTVLEAGANLIQGPTSHMDEMMLSSFTQAVIDNDIVGYVLAASSPPDVSEEALALDVIHEVATDPMYGNLKYTMHPHTAAHFRAELWQPQAFIYDIYEKWQREGGRTVLQRAEIVAREILATHQPEPLGPGQEREIRRIAAAKFATARSH
jgi:trimethylamine---corrinoid protein Co-methyltransferase